ncbi:MAG: polyphosphate kinase 2 family protein [Verrucomicrobiaceae bacterium]|nr:polyphosphate kinase 2 family protein [Verrucomicrobiaceae bacterium]
MKSAIELKDFRVTSSKFSISKAKTNVKAFYRDDPDYEGQLAEHRAEIDDLQQKMYAHDRYGLLVIFQAMDAAGKDGAIKHVMSGINPHGVEVHAFKRPSEDELDHDYMWRTQLKLPPRGRIGVFNRSYYEEVLICKVHPEIVQNSQRLPNEESRDLKKLFRKRLDDMASFEAYAHRNGIRVMKVMLHVSKDEQRKRFLERIDDPAKNWKFNSGDVAERAHWKSYMKAYEEAIQATATKDCPWYVIPADDKKNARLLAAAAILHELKQMGLEWPVLSPEEKAKLAQMRQSLLAD